MYFQDTLTATAILAALLVPLTSATCTDLNNVQTSSDRGAYFDNGGSVSVVNYACTNTNNTPCRIPTDTYPDITFTRTLNITISPESEEDNIYTLAHSYWVSQQEEQQSTNNSSSSNTTIPDFISRTVTLTTNPVPNDPLCHENASYGCLNEGSALLKVFPGKNTTIRYTPFRWRTVGVLGGCTNESLNGVAVEVSVPRWNETRQFVPGSWGSGISDIDSNGGERVRVGFGALIAALAAGSLVVGCDSRR